MCALATTDKESLISQCIDYVINVGVLLIDSDRNTLKVQFRSLEKRETISMFLFETSRSTLFLQKIPKLQQGIHSEPNNDNEGLYFEETIT